MPIEGRKEIQARPIGPWFLFSAVLTLALDRVSKSLILRTLSVKPAIPVVHNFFRLTLVKNKGAAFGLFRGRADLVILAALAALLLLPIIYLKSGRKDKLLSVSLGMMVAGAAGNIFDRIRYGYVVDFIDLRIWPVFNVADCAITIGTLILMISLLRKTSAH